MSKSKIEFRTGTHNPYTIYVIGEAEPSTFGGRALSGWMRDTRDGTSDWFIGSLPHEALVMLAVEALNAFVCVVCPWGCTTCSLNRATCECYEHDGDHPTDEELATELADTPQAGAVTRALDSLPGDSFETDRAVSGVAADLLVALAGQGWRLIHE
jgi:hypothetical protein